MKCEKCSMKVTDHTINIIWYYFHRYIIRDVIVLCNSCNYEFDEHP